jgi:hypothetical protein
MISYAVGKEKSFLTMNGKDQDHDNRGELHGIAGRLQSA